MVRVSEFKSKALLLLIATLLAVCCLASEQSNFNERKQTYEQIVKDFNVEERVKLDYNEEAGFHIRAVKTINGGDSIFRIPYDSILMPFNPFPYKHTVLKALSKTNVFDREGFSEFGLRLQEVITAFMLYIERNLKAPKDTAVPMYREKSELNQKFVNSFPERLTPLKNWDDESYEYYQEIALTVDSRENHFNEFYKLFLQALKEVAEPEEANEIVELFKDEKDLEHCIDIVVTRAFNIGYQDLQTITNKEEDFDTEEKKINYEYFRDFTAALLPGAEIVNHRFAREEDEDSIYPFEVNLGEGYIEYRLRSGYDAGEEVSVTYQVNATNSHTIKNYGLAAIGNYDNEINFEFPIEPLYFPENAAKFELCDNIGCYDDQKEEKISYKITRKELFKQKWINWFRVEQTSDKIAKSAWAEWNMNKHGYISLYNEISGLQGIQDLFEAITQLKRPRAEDENDYEEIKSMIAKKDYSTYTAEQLNNRLAAVSAAMDEKIILDLKLKLMHARVEDLAFRTCESELDNRAFL